MSGEDLPFFANGGSAGEADGTGLLVRRRLRELRWPLPGGGTLWRVDSPSGVRVDSDRGVDEEPVVEIGEKKSYSDDCCDNCIAGDEDGVGIAVGSKPCAAPAVDAYQHADT